MEIEGECSECREDTALTTTDRHTWGICDLCLAAYEEKWHQRWDADKWEWVLDRECEV